jgi:hypothetical protein
MNRAFLRIYADCRDDQEAAALAGSIGTALVLYDPIEASTPRPYWKMPELFEFTYRLSSPTRDILSELVLRHQAGWTMISEGIEYSAVWNRRQELIFLEPSVRWAELAGMP